MFEQGWLNGSVRTPLGAWNWSFLRLPHPPGQRALLSWLLPIVPLVVFMLSIEVIAQEKPPDDKSQAQPSQSQPGQSQPSQHIHSHEARNESGATSQSTLALPFKKSWQFLTPPGHNNLPPSIDASRVYLPLESGEVICLDIHSGALLWSSELGGWISVPIAVGPKAIYLFAEKRSPDGSKSGASISALDPVTGLALWAKDYPSAFTSPPVLENDRLYSGAADGAFYAISITNGDVIWKVPTGDVVRGKPLVTDTDVYFGSDDGAMREVDIAHGAEVWKYQTSGKITGRPVLDGRHLYFGSGDGSVYCADLEKKKLKWRYHTGAAIEASLALVGNHLLAGSLDNFLYALSKVTGDHLWKRRMEERVTCDPLIDGDTALVASFRGDHVAMFLGGDGRRVNYYELSRGESLLAGPVYSDGTLLLRTDKGLVVAVAEAPRRPEHSGNSKEAMKNLP
jgi:outer membrane protein assembly factor BamB